VTSALLKGYHATVVCDGDAMTGKTKTMMGENLDGVFPHLMRSMFDQITVADPDIQFTIKLSCYEVRGEDGNVVDLLSTNHDPNTSLEVELTHEDTNNVEVRDLSAQFITSVDEGLIHLKTALDRRFGSLSTVFIDLVFTQTRNDDPTDTIYTSRLCAIDLQSHLDWSQASAAGSYVIKEVTQAITTGHEDFHFFETSLKSLLFSRVCNNSLTSVIMHCSPALEFAVSSTIPSLDFLKSVEVSSNLNILT
jgi:hypothetical protein